MSLIDNIKNELENDKVSIFNDFDEDELTEEEYQLESVNGYEDLDADMTDEEIDELIEEIEKDLAEENPDEEEDPDLLEDEDIEAYESFIDLLDDEDDDEDDEYQPSDLENGLDAVEDFLEEEYDEIENSGVDPEDFED